MKYIITLIIAATLMIGCKTHKDTIDFNRAVYIMLDNGFNEVPFLIPVPPFPDSSAKVDTPSRFVYRRPKVLNRNFSDFFIGDNWDRIIEKMQDIDQGFKHLELNFSIELDSIPGMKLILTDVPLFRSTDWYIDFYYNEHNAHGVMLISNPHYLQKENREYYIFYMSYICGRGCSRDRIFYMEYLNGEFYILDFFSLYD